MPDPVVSQLLINALAIRDANAHDPSTDGAAITPRDIHAHLQAIIHVNNTHNLAIRIQAFGNIGVDGRTLALATTDAATLGPAFDVAASDSEIRELVFGRDVMPPLIYLQAQVVGAVAPTSGSITARVELIGIKPGLEP